MLILEGFLYLICEILFELVFEFHQMILVQMIRHQIDNFQNGFSVFDLILSQMQMLDFQF